VRPIMRGSTTGYGYRGIRLPSLNFRRYRLGMNGCVPDFTRRKLVHGPSIAHELVGMITSDSVP